jgi:tetratricopeptide (TPR) repeat protein/predicted Ser/Thr protein kinase
VDAPPGHPAPGNAVERLHRLEALFHQALTYPSSERATQARALCQSDPELLSELLALLDSDASVENLLHASAPTVDPQALLLRHNIPNGSGGAVQQDPWLGRTLGPFRVERILGRGGMGVVYLGQRVTEDFQQTVAIKVIARHLRSSPAVSQFLLERETLAQLQHPNIARLLDGGVYEGVPYVVMEYVDGRRIDAVCDDPATTVDTTIRLILQLCEAVDYVHRNLILHRDLKPGNVMVTVEGVVKLLDFGTLKLIAATNASSDMTQAGMRSVTLRYASPEHIRGDAVSTASDVYSLGMMLYRLLAGHLPEGMDNLPISEYLERLKTAKLQPPCVGKGIPRHLAKDLDAIVLKAIRQEPEARYSSVDALAADLSSALADTSVSAREGHLRYQAGKFYRHRRTAILGTAAVLVVLAVGLAEVARQGRIARTETRRDEAGVESERKLAHLLFKDYFDQLKQIPGSIDAQRKAVTQSVSYLDDLSRTTDSQVLQLDAAEAYRKMALLQGDPYEQNIGDPAGALASLNKAQAIAQKLKSATPNDKTVLSTLALVKRTQSEVLYGIGKSHEALDSMRSSIAIYDALVASPTVTVAQLQLTSNAYNGLGDELGEPGSASIGDSAGALSAYRKDIELSQRALSMDPKYSLPRQSIAIAHDKIGKILVRTDPKAAVDAYHQSLAEREDQPEPDKSSFRNRRGIGVNFLDLGEALTEARDYTSAISAFEQGRSIIEAYAVADPKDIRAQHDLSVALTGESLVYVDMLEPELNPSNRKTQKENASHAIELLTRSIAIQERILAVNPTNRRWIVYLAYSRMTLGSVEIKTMQDRTDGTRLATSGLAAIQKLAPVNDLTLEDLTYTTAAILRLPVSLRNPKLAIEYTERLAALDHRTTPDYLLSLAQAYHQDGQIERAQATAAEGLALLPPVPPGGTIVRTRKLLELEAQPQQRSE